MNKPAANQPENDFPKIGAPATRALTGAGISRLADLTEFTEADIKKLHGVGPKALKLLQAALDEKGLSYAPPKKK